MEAIKATTGRAKKRSPQQVLKPVFVTTRNVRNFTVMMDGLALGEGEGRFGLVYGRAGRGKSRTAVWWAANHGSPILLCATVWRTSLTEFLRDLAREIGIKEPPRSKGACYREIIEALIGRPQPIFLDEFEKLTQEHLNVVREISEITTAPFILIGEEELAPFMKRNRRVWSRTFQALEFEPITAVDVVLYAEEAAGLNMDSETAVYLQKETGGDFRLVKREVIKLAQLVGHSETKDVTMEMARTLLQTGLWAG